MYADEGGRRGEAEPRAAVVPAHAGGLDPRPLAWADGALTDGGRALLVRFLNRGTGCDWLDHVDVAESAGRVRVTVYLALNRR